MPKFGMEEIRRKQVIQAAKNCIIRNGLSNLSIKNIAAEAEISTGIIYHYFKNKEELLLQILKDSFQKSHDQVMKTVTPIHDPLDKLFKHIENINAVPKENREFYQVFLNFLGEAAHHSEIRKMIIKFFNNLKQYTDEYLNDLPGEREWQITNLSTIIYALGLGLGIMWTIDSSQFDIDEMEKSFKDLISSYLNKENERGYVNESNS